MLDVVNDRLEPSNMSVSEELAKKVRAIKGAHILVVEDSKINQQIALEMLSQAGITAVFAENGMEAIEKAETDNFDAVLMDLQMPVMDGFEATQVLRVRYPEEVLPIIAMTGDSQDQVRERCLVVGMNDHMVKSVDPDNLYEVLVKWIEPKDASVLEEVASPIIDLEDDELPENLVGIVQEVGLRSVCGNATLLKKLLIEFYDDHHNDVELIREALAEGDWVVIQRIAHTLQSTAGSLGAKGINEMATKLDEAVREEKTEMYEGVLAWLEMALVPTMESLKELKASVKAKKDIPRSGPEDREAILHLVEKLASMLNCFSADAEEVALLLHREFNEGEIRTISGQLVDELAVFDFDAANITLDKLVGALEKQSH